MSVQCADIHARANEARGFTLIELLVAVALIAIVAGISIPISRGMILRADADSATIVVTSALQVARNRAIAERREFEVHFEAPRNLRIARRPVPVGAPETVNTTVFENNQRLLRFPGTPPTPDVLGGDAEVNFTGPTPVMFTSDGSLIDAAGDPVNATIYLGVSGQRDSARAITIFGVTGLIRTWKLTSAGWVE